MLFSYITACALCSSGKGQGMPVTAGLQPQPVHGACSGWESGFPRGVKMGEQHFQPHASNPGLKQLAEIQILLLAVKYFYFP